MLLIFLFFFFKLLISSLWKGRFFNVFLIFDSECIFILYAHKNFFETIFMINCKHCVYVNDYLWLFMIICDYYDYCVYVNDYLWLFMIICDYCVYVNYYLWLFMIIYDYRVYVNDYLWLLYYLWLFYYDTLM